MRKIIGPRFTSICGPGSAPGTKTLDESVDFANMNLDEVEAAWKFAETSADGSNPQDRPPTEHDWQPLISEEKIGKCPGHVSNLSSGQIF